MPGNSYKGLYVLQVAGAAFARVQQEFMEKGRPHGEIGVNVIRSTCEPDETIGMLKKTSKQPSDDTRVASGPGTRFSKGSVTYQA